MHLPDQPEIFADPDRPHDDRTSPHRGVMIASRCGPNCGEVERPKRGGGGFCGSTSSNRPHRLSMKSHLLVRRSGSTSCDYPISTGRLEAVKHKLKFPKGQAFG
jgi:hypothetical protein